MKINKIVGKKIVRVDQERFWNKHTGSWAVHCERIVLEDGSTLIFHVIETETEYAIGVNRYKA